MSGVVHEKKGDLFRCFDDDLCEPERLALCHCVSRDFEMGKGIAKIFKEKYGRKDELLAQEKRVGQCAYLMDGKTTVYYLVTKEYYYGKPTTDTLRSSLLDMKSDALKKKISVICMPRIGCGLDRLSWEDVKKLLIEIFENSEISVYVYVL